VQKLLAAWRWCASEDFLETVPWEKYRHLPEEPHSHWCGNFDDFRRVYASCAPALQWAIRTCLALCLRPGKEVINLKWRDVDLVHGRASVWMPKTRRQKVVFCPRWWLDEARQKAQGRNPEEPVCPSPHGKPYSTIKYFWHIACQKAGVDRFPMYTVRHMAASLMLEAGADIAAVAAQLGHKNITTTGAFYTHAVAGAQERAAQDLPALPS
jgi:integrase